MSFFISRNWISVTDILLKIVDTRIGDEIEFLDNEAAFFDENAFSNDSISGEEVPRKVQESFMATWSLLDQASEVGVMNSGGTMVRGQNTLLRWYDPLSKHGIHLNLDDGTIGSGTGYFHKQGFESENDNFEKIQKLRFGSFLYQPVFLQLSEFRTLLSEIVDSAVSFERSHELSQRIVEAFDNGEPVTKAWVRSRFFREMKVAEFQAVWSEAASLRPDLSKPGPRSMG